MEATAVRPSTSTGCDHCLLRILESFLHRKQYCCGTQCIATIIAAVAAFINATDTPAPQICRSGLATPTPTHTLTTTLSNAIISGVVVEICPWTKFDPKYMRLTDLTAGSRRIDFFVCRILVLKWTGRKRVLTAGKKQVRAGAFTKA